MNSRHVLVARTALVGRGCLISRGDLPCLSEKSQLLRTREHRVANLHMELPDEGVSLEDVERELLLAALHKHAWNQTRAAAFLKITRSTLLYRMRKFGLERENTPAEPTSDA